jgi:hypothetical protein
MRLLILTLLALIATSAKPNDSLKVRNNQGLVFAQFGGVPSIFTIGYGHVFRKDKKVSWGVLGGFGIDFIRFRPYYNIETELKARIQYNLNPRHALIFEVGSQYVFNLWYMNNPDKFFPDCTSQICPDALFNHFIDLGYRHTFQNGLSFIGQMYLNYHQNGYFYPLPCLEINYSFGRKRRLTY